MKMRTLVILAGFLVARAEAQSILFDFNNVPEFTPFPINVTVGGITAHLSGTGAGYSIQSATTAPVAPVGFSGNDIYPSSIYLSDLVI